MLHPPLLLAPLSRVVLYVAELLDFESWLSLPVAWDCGKNHGNKQEEER